MNEIRERLAAALATPAPAASVSVVVSGWPATRAAYAAGWRAVRKAGWTAWVPMLRSVVCLAVLLSILGSITAWGAVAAVGVVPLYAAASAVRGREGRDPLRVLTLGEDRETVEVRFCPGSLVVEGWAYLDARPIGCRRRPIALRVLDFAATEALTVHASVSAAAPGLRTLYAEFGFVETPSTPRRWGAAMTYVTGLRVVHLVRPVSHSASGR